MPRQDIAIAYDCLYPYSTGGGEKLYRGYAQRLAADGTRVDYLTSRQWDAQPDESAFHTVAITGRLSLYNDAGVRRIPPALRFASRLFTTLVGRRRRYRAVIVSGLPVFNVFAARAALWGSGTTLIVDYLEVWGRRQWQEYAGSVTGTIAWAMQRLALRATPIATCHSALTAEQMRREGFRGTLVQSPGLIEQPRETTPRLETGGDPFVLYAGRHIPDKRVESLPAAVALARRVIPELRLVVLGDGPSTPDVRAAVAAHGAEEWTQLPGFVEQDRLDELMSAAACLVNPSRREGYGLVVVEAAAHGTPVVLVQDPGNASVELVSPGQNGYVAISTQPRDLADAIVRAVEGGADLRRAARSWYETAIRTRTLDATVSGISETIDRDRDRRSRKQQGSS